MPAKKFESKHILLVDDDPLLRRLFGGKLASMGHNVIYATNGNEGREVARRLTPDLILMDINMPGYENGLETAHRLKSEEQTKHIPIILLSNVDASVDAEKKIKELAADGFIHKSVELDEFANRVTTFFTSQKKQQKKR